MGVFFVVTILVTVLADQGTLGARCRFSSTSDNQESCIFPCRCTDGCNTTTGDCLNGGRCEDGYPSGYRWSGSGCQIGNVAYKKTASQNKTLQWSSMFPANRAVDGNTDPRMANGHCAHPEAAWGSNAWWMVDLGDTHNISTVIIYNRASNSVRLSTFILSVGNSSDRTRHRGCASHHGLVGPTVNVSCTTAGRYLSFRRDGGTESCSAGLCEVVVIAHKHISCAKCPSTSQCNDVLGCEACSPGKRQPSCVKDCEQGTYGKNCEENCGHCKDTGQCDIKNGHCLTGCQLWYATDVCKGYIHKPYFEPNYAPSVEDVTSSSVKVSWTKAKTISSGLEMYYSYTVWLQTGEGISINVSRVPQEPEQQQLHFLITGLTPNTNYSVYVEPYRQHGMLNESGRSTKFTWFITSIIATIQPAMYSPTASMMRSGASGAGLAAGVSVGVIIIFILVCVIIFFIIWRRRAEKNARNQSNTTTSFDAGMQLDEGEENAGFEPVRAEERDNGETWEAKRVAEPEYVNTQLVTRSVAVGDIAAYVERKRGEDGFKSEFMLLPTGIQASCTAAKTPQNKNKNRFQDIVAYDHTRVVIAVDKKGCDYINANYIMGYNKTNAYIACQGPRNTTIDDMWRMVWQVNSNTIVMLANLLENGKEKCCLYWPVKNGRRSSGSFSTEGISEEKVADYVIRQFSLTNEETGEVRRIRQLHFTSWPDRGTPPYAYPLLAFHRKVHSFDRAIRGPLVVHCSAGVGRTGTFMAIDILIQQAAAEGKIDVFQCINQLRTQRMSMVQTLDQYVFVYQAMIESSQATVVLCSSLSQTFDELRRNHQIEHQFERLNALKPLAKKIKCAALDPVNVGKNRHLDIIPDDQHRPYLLTPWKECNNYVNAVFVNGYKDNNAYIVTQSPMASTVVDMWRLLADHESRTVVLLDDCDVTDDQCTIYWPTNEGTELQFGPFQVELVKTDVNTTSNITVRKFNVTTLKHKKTSAIVLKQFHMTGIWRQGASLPSNKTVVVELLSLVEKWQQMSGNGPVTVQCSDGASRCGLVCAASYVLEHMKVEQEVDVFHAVQHIRTSRPQFIVDKEQYGFLYEIALEYMSLFNEYANFH